MKLKNTSISKVIEQLNLKVKSISSLSGGCISNAYKVTLESDEKLFLKFNDSASGGMFIKEAHGLEEIKNANAIRVPDVIKSDKDFILLEYIESSSRKRNFFEEFGIQFAKLHKYHNNDFGFYEDNYIGSNVQKNTAKDELKTDWTKFYFQNRILFQYKLAEKNGYATNELKNGISELENKIGDIIRSSKEEPSLLHGDLWSGNYMEDENGSACLIDPAVYYGHREADLAMTKLFGGFSSEFYSAYNEAYPLPDGYSYRENLYKLYHVLNHLNLFGGGYYDQAISLIKSYI
jgi:protein-ribulosamine 3-kinase